MTNIRKQRNFIHVARGCNLNLEELGWLPMNLQLLEVSFSVDEIKSVVMEASKEKAPVPDGYIESFFSHCWNIIKDDLVKVVDQFYLMNQQGLYLLNQALVVLIPKKKEAHKVSDYRPIRLTHNFVKIISKLLAAS
jgi:hypothetical protein